MAFRELQPEEWLDEIRRGLEYRRKFGLEDVWSTLESIYYNVHESMSCDGPNILLSQGDAMMSLLTVPSMSIKVKPLTPESVDRAPYLETVDNTLLDELRVSEEVDTTVLHTWLFGRGIVKIGYDSEWGYDESLDIGGSLKLGITLSQLDKTGRRQIEHNSKVQAGMPWLKAVMPHDIIVPWGTKEISNAPYIIHRVVRSLDDVKADPKYSNTRDLRPQTSMKDFVDSYRMTNKGTKLVGSETADFVELFEIHDRRTGKIYVVTWDHPKFLRNEINSLQIENRLPFVSIGFTPRARSFWTTPDAYYLLHVQNELSDVARQRTKQRRIAGLKFLYDGDAITDEELMKILSPDVGVAAKVESGRDILKTIIPLQNNPNQQLIMEEETLRANAREQIGFSRNQLGEYTGGRKTAREVGAVERSSELRMSRRGLAVKRLYQDILEVMNGIIFKHWTIGRYVQVMGQQNAQEWMQLNGPMLEGRYNYQVEFVNTNEVEQRKIQALQLYGMLSQDPTVDNIELRKFLVRQVNDPSFARLFNANIRRDLQQMQAQGGGGSAQPQAPAAGLQQMLQQGGQAGQSPAQGLLA